MRPVTLTDPSNGKVVRTKVRLIGGMVASYVILLGLAAADWMNHYLLAGLINAGVSLVYFAVEVAEHSAVCAECADVRERMERARRRL